MSFKQKLKRATLGCFGLLGILYGPTLAFGGTDFSINPAVYDANVLPFVEHSGLGEWDNYLTMDIPFPPVADLFRQLLIDGKRPLTNRGESHITVVTPVEFWNVLRPSGVSIEDINQIAVKANIQALPFEVVCLGRGQAVLDGKLESAFFIVVKSEALIEVRKEIQKLFLSRNGKPGEFDAEKFYPHVTVGYTNRDLHESDGIIKNQKSCVKNLVAH